MDPRFTRRDLLLAFVAGPTAFKAQAATAKAASPLDQLRRQFDVPSLAAVGFSSNAVLAEGISGVRRRGAKAPATLQQLRRATPSATK